MQETIDWDALRLALAIARAGSLAGAAQRLAVSHATVFRRLNALEQAWGASLFERGRQGYVPTTVGVALVDAAARVEQEILALEHRVHDNDLGPSGTVRLTTTDTLFEGLLAPMLSDCRQTLPEVSLEVAISNDVLNLSRRQADMAIRPIARPPERSIAYRLGSVALAVYAPADRAGNDMDNPSTWVGLDDSVDFPVLADWMDQHVQPAQWRYRLDTMLGIRTAVRSGAGRAVLPCYLADRDPGLRRLGGPIPGLTTDLWLLTHPALRGVARVRAIRDVLSAAFEAPALQARLAGLPDKPG